MKRSILAAIILVVGVGGCNDDQRAGVNEGLEAECLRLMDIARSGFPQRFVSGLAPRLTAFNDGQLFLNLAAACSELAGGPTMDEIYNRNR